MAHVTPQETRLENLRMMRNRALRAEAECETAIHLLINADLQNMLMRDTINRAHSVIDVAGIIVPRARSHRGLCSRVLAVVCAYKAATLPLTKHPVYRLDDMSSEALGILKQSYEKHGVPIPIDLETAISKAAAR